MVSTTLIDDLKAQARILHRHLQSEEPFAVARMRAARHAPPFKRGDCLSAIARELGFRGWPHALAVLSGEPQEDYGTLLYPSRCGGHWNIWSANYAEAKTIAAQHGGYLLAYKQQFLIVEVHFIESLGVDPHDADWERIGRDWARPADVQAWLRLCEKVVRARCQASAEERGQATSG